MSQGLLPSIEQSLATVIQRRQRLVWLRGIAATAGIAGLALLAAVACDATGLWPDDRLSVLTLFVYGALAVAVVVYLVLPRWRQFTTIAAARTIEEREPRLRDRLLAAVELANEEHAPSAGAAAFIQSLQADVSSRLTALDLRQVLPWRLVRTWLALGASVVLALVLASVPPSWQFPRRALRVLFPLANVGRPSLVEVAVLAPSPASTVVAAREVVAFEVSTYVPPSTGLGANSVAKTVRPPVEPVLEVKTSTAGVRDVPLLATTTTNVREGERRFRTQMLLSEEDCDYRVRVGAGATAWYRLQVRPRPAPSEFRQVLRAPPYAGVADREVVGPLGDIDAVAGTEVRLTVVANQPLKSAELKWRSANRDLPLETLALTPDSPTSWSTTLMLKEDATYRVAGVSAESGLESGTSLSYRVRSRTDSRPVVRWVSPDQRQVVVSPQTLLAMAATAEDEFPLKRVEQWVRVDRGAWHALPLMIDAGRAEELTWTLDVMAQGWPSGTLVETRVVAIDRKDQRGESSICELVVSGATLDPAPTRETELRVALSKQLAELAQKAASKQAALNPRRAAWEQQPQSAEAEDAYRQALRETSAALQQDVQAAQQAVREALPQINETVSATELERALDLLAHLQGSVSAELQAALDGVPNNDSADVREPGRQLQRAQELTDRAVELTRMLDDRMGKFVAHDVLRDMAEDLDAALKFQKEIMRDGEAVGSESWRRRQALLGKHLRDVGTEMSRREPQVRGNDQNVLRDWAKWTLDQANRVDEMLARDEMDTPALQQALHGPMEQLRNELQHHQQLQNAHGNLSGEGIEGRRHLEETAGLPSEVLTRAADRLREASSRGEPVAANDIPVVAAAVKELAERRDTQYARSDADARFAADVGLATRAAQAVLADQTKDSAAIRPANETAQQRSQRQSKELQDLAAQLKPLEALHRVRAAEELLADLLQQERFGAHEFAARGESPRAWDAYSEQMGKAVDLLRQQNIPREIADAMDRLRWSGEAPQVNQKIGARRWNPDESSHAIAELESLQRNVAEQREQLAQAVQPFRELLESQAPSIPELARAAAEETRAQMAETEAAAQAQEVAGPELAARLARYAAELRDSQQPAKQLQHALQDLAAVQNVLERDEREVALDADAARLLVEHDRVQTDAARQAALAQSEAPAERLVQLAGAQQKSVETFEKVAQHFEQLADGKAMSAEELASREAMRNAAADAMANSQPAYAELEEFARLAATTPEALRSQLEAELAQNPEMRAALKDVAQDIAAQSRDSLRMAERQEHHQRVAVEHSDPLFEQQRAELQRELGHAADRADRLMNRLQGDAQSTAGRAKEPEAQQQLQTAAQELREARDQVRRLSGNAPVAELRSAASELAEAMQQAIPLAQQAAEQLGQAKEQKPLTKEKDLAQAKKDMEQVQKRAHQQDEQWADETTRRREQQLREAEQRLQQFDQQRNQAREQRDRARGEAERHPERGDVQQRLAEAEARMAASEATRTAAEALRGRADAALQQARAQRHEVGQQAPTAPQSQNPAAETAERLATQVAAQAQRMQQQLAQLAAEAEWQQQLQVSQGELRAAETRQQAIQQSVASTAADLARAARHEERLGTPSAAEALKNVAEKVAHVAQGEVQAAAAALQQASASEGAQSPARQAGAAESGTAAQALRQAEQSLRSPQADLAQAMAQQQRGAAAAATPPVNTAQQPSRSGLGSLLTPTEMARLLDELDQQSGTAAAPASMPPSLAASAQRLQNSLNRERATSVQPARSAAAIASSGAAATPASGPGASLVTSVPQELVPVENWSQLRKKNAEDVVETERESVSPHYRRRVDAYFKALSDRTARQSP